LQLNEDGKACGGEADRLKAGETFSYFYGIRPPFLISNDLPSLLKKKRRRKRTQDFSTFALRLKMGLAIPSKIHNLKYL
jgi:hypothetical protein